MASHLRLALPVASIASSCTQCSTGIVFHCNLKVFHKTQPPSPKHPLAKSVNATVRDKTNSSRELGNTLGTKHAASLVVVVLPKSEETGNQEPQHD